MRIRPVHLLVVVAAIPILMVALPQKVSRPDESPVAVGGDEHLRVLLAEANAKLEGREYFGAIRRFELLLASDGGPHAEAYLGLARCSFELEDLSWAEDYAANALSSATIGSVTHAAALDLAAAIDEALGHTLDVVLPALKENLSDGGRREVEIVIVDGSHCGLRVRDGDGNETSIELEDLSPYAVVAELPGTDLTFPFVLTVTSPFGERLRLIEAEGSSGVSSASFDFVEHDDARRAAELFKRAVLALTDYKLGSLDEEIRRIVAAMDQRSVCVSGEFMLVGGSRELSSYSVAKYTVSNEGDGVLRIQRRNKDVIEMDGAGGEWGVDWRIDLSQVEHVAVVRVEKRTFGSWLVRGTVGRVSFGDLEEEIDAVQIGPASAFDRAPAFRDGESRVLLLPAGERAQALAMSLHNATFLARQ